MKKTAVFRNDIFIEHDPGFDHIESPYRLITIYDVLDALSPTDRFIEPVFSSVSSDILRLNHTDDQIETVRSTSGKIYSVLDEDTFTSRQSYNAACHGVGAVTTGVDLLLEGAIENGFTLVRPPGHHAEPSKAMGFCLFNNIAIGAHYALRHSKTERVLIIDWDVHHGNGTQNAFYSNDKILYVSIHQSPFYPGTGLLEETGTGLGEGYTINIPLPGGQGDSEYANIFNTIVRPLGNQYQPDLILVSAGFDGYHGDAISSMYLTNQGFGYMTRVLVEMAEELCDGRLLLSLEGGYDQSGLKEGVFTVLSELCGKKIETGFSSNLDEDIAQKLAKESEIHPAVERVRDVAKKYWRL